MSAQQQTGKQQSSSGTGHPNEPRDRAQREQGAQPDEPKFTVERKRYLAGQYGYTEEQVDVIRLQICPSASDTELEFFLATCKRVQLDPFSRQIYFIKRKQRQENDWGDTTWVDVGRPEVSIDGLRACAERTEQYEGQAPMQWCGDDGKWVDVWLRKTEPPHAARSTIFRKGLREPMVTVALFDEFCPKFKGKGSEGEKVPAMWKKMAANQLAKCAEAAGFRRAFPRDMSGLYISEEMEHTSAGATEYTAPTAAASSKPVVDATAVEVKQLPAQTATAPIAEMIAGWTKMLDDAKTRGDLAPVGKVLSDAKNRTDDDSKAITAALTAKFQDRYRTLPPAQPAKK